MTIVGVLLAGGRSQRMGGGDKCLRLLAGRSLLTWVIDRAKPQVAALSLNASGPSARFGDIGLPVVADSVEGFAGPLAGLLAGFDWAAAAFPGATHLVTFATDAPFLPRDLVARLAAARGDGATIVCAASLGRTHPTFGLWPVSLREELRRALCVEGIRKAGDWAERHPLVVVNFPAAPVDPFFNANRPEDLDAAERLMRLAP